MDSPHFDFIDGQWCTSRAPDETVTLHSPADTREVVARWSASRSQVDAAVDAARRAAVAWRRTPLEARATLLRAYQVGLKRHADALALAISREIGKPLWEAKTEVSAMVTKVDVTLTAGLEATRDTRLDDLPGEVRHRPHGVAAVLGPFNFPGHLPNGQLVPALALGNTVVFKPSEKGSGTAVLMARCFAEAGLPPGVFNLVQGGAAIASHLSTHADIDAVLFTGSLAVGQRIVAANAHRPGVLVALELGGKNASLVLDDCELDRTVREVAFSAFATAGQRCTATSRVIVMRAVADAFCAKLAKAARNAVVGHPSNSAAFLGPVISSSVRTQLIEAQRAAVAAGFEALAPGGPVELAHPGWYVQPAVHRAPNPSASVHGYSDVELFAPDVSVVVVESLEEALAVANDTPYGLSAAVFTASRERFEVCADGLKVGVLHWNRSSAGASGRLPFGGIRGSGNHRPGGVLMGSSCVYPMGLLLPPVTAQPLPTWPGLPFE